MDLVIVTDPSDPIALVSHAVLLVNLANVQLGRMLYISGLYLLDDLKTLFLLLTAFIPIPGMDMLLAAYDDLLFPMHALLDILDLVSVEEFLCVTC